MKILMRGRKGASQDVEINEVMVVLSDGGNNAGCPPVLQAANAAKGQGILLITICVGADCDAALMRQVASSPRYYFQIEDMGSLGEVFRRIQEIVTSIVLKRMTVKDVLPDNMRYVDGSADPEPKSISPNQDVLTWETSHVPVEGVTFTFKVEPLEAGYWPTNLEASLTFLDNKNRQGEKMFPVPWVNVLQPEVLATAVTPTFTPTFTPSPTGTTPPSPTPTPTPTVTPTPRPKPIYLPILVWHTCRPEAWYSDVALVLDISTSMNLLTTAGRPKLQAILEGAKWFATGLRLEPDTNGEHDQMAVAGFNATGWIEQGLTNNLHAINTAIDRLPAKQRVFTRLDLAMQTGVAATNGSAHRAENKKVIIMLTDGKPTMVPRAEDGTMETAVLRAADAAKTDGNLVYTIGVGVDLNHDLLVAMASAPDMAYFEPDAEQIKPIFEQIHGDLVTCPDDRSGWAGSWP
jgi:hypothetical protein